MKNVLILSHDADLAGVNYRIKVAFDKYSTRYRVRQVVGKLNYIEYPYDIMWMGNNELVNNLYQEAQIVHLTENEKTLTDFVPRIWNPVEKPTVLHQHGTTFRWNPKHYTRLCAQLGWRLVVSTIDLDVAGVDAWIPNPVDLGAMADLRRQHYPADGRIRLGHAPTNRTEKDTSVFEANAIRLAAERKDVDFDIIEGRPWTECLTRKARTDIWYDQMTYGYGNNGIEAMAMGIPTLGGFADERHAARLAKRHEPVGICPVTKDTLGTWMRWLVESPDMRKEWGEDALDYVTRVHAEQRIVKLWEEIYDRT